MNRKASGTFSGDPIEALRLAEKDHLMGGAGLLREGRHHRRLEEKPFTEEQRSKTTILFGSITPKHEAFIKAVFEGCGYRCQNLPTPTNSVLQTGREYCNNGLCNPNYYTAGNLIQYLRELQKQGLERQQINDGYLHFSAGGCGPCRFGMYESEYRQALHNAGFPGFRVITFQSNRVIREGSEQPGLEYTMDLGLGSLNALILGDLLYGMTYQIRPYEVRAGETNRAMEECVQELADFLRSRPRFEILERTPRWFSRRLQHKKTYKNLLNNFGKFHEHLYGKAYQAILARCSKRLHQIEVDRTRPKPIVKIVGEFFSQIQESDANFNVFSFLEKEGAEVAVDSMTSLLQYWLYFAQLQQQARQGLVGPYESPAWWQLRRLLANRVASLKKPLLFKMASRIYARQFHRIAEQLGGLARPLPPQEELDRLARPFFNPLIEGGEGHLEVAKSIYYTTHHLCHMVLALKPFGCMPSTQSDGVMASVASRFDGLLFLSIETSGEGEINAQSRIQMALGEAHRKARAEFERALQSTGKRLEDIREYVFSHPELRRPFYRFPRRPETVGNAANFIQHVSDLMDRKASRQIGR